MIYMSDITFDCANVPVSVAAQALKMDSQTVHAALDCFNRALFHGGVHTKGHQKASIILI